MIEIFKKFIIPYVFNDIKVYLSIISVFFFTLVYSFCKDDEFHGWIDSSKYTNTDEKKFLSEIYSNYKGNKKYLYRDDFLRLPIIEKDSKFYLVSITNKELDKKKNKKNKEILFSIFDKENKNFLTLNEFLSIPILLDEMTDFSATYKSSFPSSKNNKKPTAVTNIFDRFYFSTIIQSNLGLGDIFPASRRVRLIMLLQIFIAYSIIVLPLQTYKMFL